MEETASGVFVPSASRLSAPGRIVTLLGAYYPVARVMEANGALRYLRENTVAEGGYNAAAPDTADVAAALRATKWVNALNQGRKWARTRLFERLDPLLAPGIALTLVPSHDPFVDAPPLRLLARDLAALRERVDATGCLVRHTKIKRIAWGGPSFRSLHRQSIGVREPALLAGRAVLLLDDIVRSGASLRACTELLYEAGAASVQPLALGRVAPG